ncbi:SH3 domain-containing protein [Paenibacillus sp. NPDC057886]|uniref:SH3 domain-containing protein n=1 Tax=Paenibacillus sp. NPDC057886 TaxID=3346270 RepID=UPI003698B3C9
MLKKFIAVLLVTATTALPATAAFASENPQDRISPNNQLTQDSRITEEPGSDLVTIMTSTYEITANNVNFRKTASSSGTILGQLQKGDLVNGGSEQVTSGGITWVSVYSYKHGVWGWVASQYLNEVG